MTMANFSIDHYPYHEYRSSRKHWMKYNEVQSDNFSEWVTKLHEQWHAEFNTAKACVPHDEQCKLRF